MHPQKEAICVIPARGGSKRIVGKNIRPIGGIPMIGHAIRTAVSSGCFKRIIVSTDDEEIASISREYGAETPFVRDAELSNDHAGTAPVVVDAINKTNSYNVDFTCCIYPTTPLLRSSDVSDAMEKLVSSEANALLSVTDFDYPPMRALKTEADGTVAFNWPKNEMTRSQDLPELLHDAGQFYWMRTQAFLLNPRLVPEGTIGFRLERLRCADIDTEEDLAFAEALYAYVQQNN